MRSPPATAREPTLALTRQLLLAQAHIGQSQTPARHSLCLWLLCPVGRKAEKLGAKQVVMKTDDWSKVALFMSALAKEEGT